MAETIYLNNAATSWPKPEAVYTATDRALRSLQGAPARSGGHTHGVIDQMIERLRHRLAEFFNAPSPQSILFGFNGTDALNLAIRGTVRPGDHVVTTATEHNSVLRPLRWLEEHAGVTVTRVGCDGKGYVDLDALAGSVRPDTSLIAVNHASNVTGTLQPLEEVCRRLRDRRGLLLVDAAQSAGHVPIDTDRLGIDLLALPGHKGLLGPMGTGVLYMRPELQQRVEPLRRGGTGTRSDEDRQPSELPDRYESGTLNTPGLAGLAAGLDYVNERGIDALRQHELELTAQLIEGINALDGVHLVGPGATAERVGVVSVTVDGYEPGEVAALLESQFGIQVRAGIHCAPRLHEALGTRDGGGTVRFSTGPFNQPAHIEAALRALAEIAAQAM